MDMNQHSATETRENLKENPVDVAANFGHMGGVDEQDIARFQRIKDTQVHILYLAVDDSDGIIQVLEQRPQQIGVGLNARNLCSRMQKQPVCVDHRTGGMA